MAAAVPNRPTKSAAVDARTDGEHQRIRRERIVKRIQRSESEARDDGGHPCRASREAQGQAQHPHAYGGSGIGERGVRLPPHDRRTRQPAKDPGHEDPKALKIGTVRHDDVRGGRFVQTAIGHAIRIRRGPGDQSRAPRRTSPASPARSSRSSCRCSAAAGQFCGIPGTRSRGPDRDHRHRDGEGNQMNGHAPWICVRVRDERARACADRDDGDRCGEADEARSLQKREHRQQRSADDQECARRRSPGARSSRRAHSGCARCASTLQESPPSTIAGRCRCSSSWCHTAG